MHPNSLAAILFLFLSIPCKAQKGISQKDPGWQMFNYPRTHMPPGYVFRIKEGEKDIQEVTVLKPGKPFDTAYVYLPDTYVKRKFSGQLFLKFLFLNPTDSTLQVSGNRNVVTGIGIGKGFVESIDEPTIDAMVKNSGINWKENNKYYIIQATLSSGAIRYKNEKAGGFNASTILNFKKVHAGMKINRDMTDSTVLVQEFDMRYRIYYRAIEINPMGASSSNLRKFTYRQADIRLND